MRQGRGISQKPICGAGRGGCGFLGKAAGNWGKLPDMSTSFSGPRLPDFPLVADPVDPVDALLRKARARHEAGALAEAEPLYQAVLGRAPDHAETLHLLGVLKAQQGAFPLAVALIGRAIALAPDRAEFHNNIVPALMRLGRLPEAEAHVRKALALRPDFPSALNNLGTILLERHAAAEAEAAFRRALGLEPALLEARLGLGRALAGLGRAAEAEQALRAVLGERPRWPDALYALGRLLVQADRLVEAEPVLRLVLGEAPAHAEALTALGLVFAERGRPAEAEPLLREALRLQPGNPLFSCNLGQLLLSMGLWAEGWALTEARTRLAGAPPLPAFPCPPWRGEPLAGKSLLIWPEQGHGDMIQFCRYIPWLKAQGAARISVCCAPPLAPLLRGLEGLDGLYEQREGRQDLPAHDYWTLPLSLPGLTGALPERLPYLAADPGRTAAWAARLAALPAHRRKVGLAWKGSPLYGNDRFRSLPDLAPLAPLWSVPGLAFVSLQKGAGEDQAQTPPAAQPLLALGAEARDFADMAALIAGLDLVITVDTAIAHLAGALGKPCWVMLPARGTDWRWLRGHAATPWYPGVMSLFRQEPGESWEEVAQRLAAALRRCG
ncbi:beta-barrel assembly-enhancing protease [mine drainage metagenome]|uniref:Beta-barrel assembly-enhancing protease n=1 Tax=mine drainage metagenome TaxID=410659 RepID=A0A1J5T169_9ZZZZ